MGDQRWTYTALQKAPLLQHFLVHKRSAHVGGSDNQVIAAEQSIGFFFLG
jgi:hypothetical protein